MLDVVSFQYCSYTYVASCFFSPLIINSSIFLPLTLIAEYFSFHTIWVIHWCQLSIISFKYLSSLPRKYFQTFSNNMDVFFSGRKIQNMLTFQEKVYIHVIRKTLKYFIGKNHRYKLPNMLTFGKKYTRGIILCIKTQRKFC